MQFVNTLFFTDRQNVLKEALKCVFGLSGGIRAVVRKGHSSAEFCYLVGG